MEVMGLSPARLVVNGLGAVGGLMVADRYILPALPASILGIPTSSGAGKFGLDDVISGIAAVLGAAVANSIYSKAKA